MAEDFISRPRTWDQGQGLGTKAKVNVIGHINEAAVRRAGLVLRWVTVHGYTISVFNQATQANSAWSSLCGYWRWLWLPLGKKMASSE